MSTAVWIFGIAILAVVFITYRHSQRSWEILAAQYEIDLMTVKRREMRAKQRAKQSGGGSAREKQSGFRAKKAEIAAAVRKASQS